MIFDKVKTVSTIAIEEYPFHKQLYDELVPILEDYPDQQNRGTNVKATMTEWEFDQRGDYCKLNILKKYLLSVACDGPFWFTDHLPFYEGFWGNIYHRDDYTKEHDHNYSYISCVYFLKSPRRSSPLVVLIADLSNSQDATACDICFLAPVGLKSVNSFQVVNQ